MLPIEVQKRNQRRRRWTEQERLQALENAVSAADLDLASKGMPFKLSLEQAGDRLVLVLSEETREGSGRREHRSGAFTLADIDPNEVRSEAYRFLESRGIKI